MDEKMYQDVEVENVESGVKQIATYIGNILAEYRESGNFCSVDRVNNFAFGLVSFDGCMSYSPGVILIERLYKKENASTVTRTSSRPSDEAINLHAEMQSLMKNKEENLERIQEIVKQIAELPLETKEVPLNAFKLTGYGLEDDNLITFPMSEFPPEYFAHLADTAAAYVYSYFSFCGMSNLSIYKLVIDVVNNPDYVDLVAYIKQNE